MVFTPDMRKRPIMPDPVESKETAESDIASLEAATKKYKLAEGKMMDQIKELRVSQMLDATTWEEMLEAFNTKQDA